jgi:futalosine hydrolase
MPAATPLLRLLVVVASDLEASAVAAGMGLSATTSTAWNPIRLSDHADLLVTGVGKANAAAGAASVLSRGQHRALLSIGIAGVLPGGDLAIGSVARITGATLADEGVRTPSGFKDIASMGFPPLPGLGVRTAPDLSLLSRLAFAAPVGAEIATVSTCSGTDALAHEIAARTGARLEDMETAATAVACGRLGVAWCGMRVASNTTGDRDQQRWDMPGALGALRAVIGPALAALVSDAL